MQADDQAPYVLAQQSLRQDDNSQTLSAPERMVYTESFSGGRYSNPDTNDGDLG